MSKIIVGLLAIVGCLFVVNAYAPSLWTSGFMVGGVLVRYAYFALGGVGYLVYRLKSK
jgi:hypothetical protein